MQTQSLGHSGGAAFAHGYPLPKPPLVDGNVHVGMGGAVVLGSVVVVVVAVTVVVAMTVVVAVTVVVVPSELSMSPSRVVHIIKCFVLSHFREHSSG